MIVFDTSINFYVYAGRNDRKPVYLPLPNVWLSHGFVPAEEQYTLHCQSL